MYTIWKMPKWIKTLTIQITTQVIFGVFPPNLFLSGYVFHGYLCGVSITEAILCEWFSHGIIISYSITTLQKFAFWKWHSLLTCSIFVGHLGCFRVSFFFFSITMFLWPFLHINFSTTHESMRIFLVNIPESRIIISLGVILFTSLFICTYI